MKATMRMVRTRDLVDHPDNIRDHLDGVDELAASMRSVGVLQPLIVNDVAGTLVVTDGHRRLAAARRADLQSVPCLVTVDAGERDVLTTMLATAMHRELTPLEQAHAFKRLRDQGVGTVDITHATGYTANLIRNRLMLLDLPQQAQTMVAEETITLGQATELAKQVRTTRTGTAPTKSSRSAWLTSSHRLAAHVTSCTHADTRTVVGGVACGQCWEAAIRADERGQLEDLPAHDEVLVGRVLAGERLTMSRADRLEGVRRLVRERLSDTEIADRLHCTPRQVLRDRQALDLETPFPQNRPQRTSEQVAS